MKLPVIAGFLGSGKTTLLLEVAQRLTAVSQKIAIIENEVGEMRCRILLPLRKRFSYAMFKCKAPKGEA